MKESAVEIEKRLKEWEKLIEKRNKLLNTMEFEQIEERDRLPVRTLTEEEIRELVEAVYSSYKPPKREIVMFTDNPKIYYKAYEEVWKKHISDCDWEYKHDEKPAILDETSELKPMKITCDLEGNIIDVK